MRAVAIALDGVLRKPMDTDARDMGGFLLYASLVDNFRVVVLGGYDQEADEHFLTINGMHRHVRVEPLRRSDHEDPAVQRQRQVDRLRAEGFHFEFVVVPDPDLATYLYSRGYAVLTYLHPLFSSPSHRPDYVGGVRAWSELAAEVDYQVTTRAEQIKRETTQQ